jgi:hypothetical protein
VDLAQRGGERVEVPGPGGHQVDATGQPGHQQAGVAGRLAARVHRERRGSGDGGAGQQAVDVALAGEQAVAEAPVGLGDQLPQHRLASGLVDEQQHPRRHPTGQRGHRHHPGPQDRLDPGAGRVGERHRSPR